MASKYWIKVWHELLTDIKMAQLRDRLYRRTIECFLFAGQEDDDGYLPDLNQMAWTLHTDPESLETEFGELAQVGILQIMDGRWHVTHFADRQAKMSKAEYMRRKREAERKEEYYQPVDEPLPASDQPVTSGNTDKKRIDKNREEMPPALAAPVFLNAWGEWKQHRKQAGKKMTPITVKRQLNKLAKHSPETAAAMLGQSMDNGWLGVFDLKEKKAGANGKAPAIWATIEAQMNKRGVRDGPDNLPDEAMKAIKLSGGWNRLCQSNLEEAERAFMANYREVTYG